MSFNHKAFFDFLESEKASLMENKKAFHDILFAFMEGTLPNLDDISIEQIDAFEQDYSQLHFVRNRDGSSTLSGQNCLLKEMLQTLLLMQSLETVEKKGEEDELFI